MKYITALAIFFSFTIYAENSPQTKELFERLEQAEVLEEKAPIYTQIVKQTWQSEPQIAEEYGHRGLALHDKIHLPEDEAYLIAYLIRVYVDRSDLDAAEVLIERGTQAANQTDNKKLKANNLFYRALIYYLQDRLVLALNAFLNLEQVYIDQGRASNLGSVYNNIGNAYLNLGDLHNALEYFQKALPLQENGPNPASYASIVMNIGRVFFRLEDYEQAESNYLIGLSLIDRETYPRVYSEAQGHLGKLYQATGKYEEALHHFKIGEEVALTSNNFGKLFYSYIDQVMLALESDDDTLLVDVISKLNQLNSLELNENQKYNLNYIRALYALEIEDWENAEKSIDLVIEDSTFESPYFSLRDALALALKIKTAVGKIDEAGEMLLESLALHERQSSQNREGLIAQYAQLYKLNQKEQELQSLKQESLVRQNQLLQEQTERRQTLFVFIVSSVVLVALMVLIVQRYRNLSIQKSLNEQLLTDKKQFFADISHELRTPLTVFKLKMEELEHNIADSPENTYRLLHERIDSFNYLIDDISMLAKSDQGELELNLENVDFSKFISGQLREYTSLIEEHELRFDTDIQDIGSGEMLTIDPHRVKQVLDNLFSNVCRYTDAPGEVRFSASQTGKYFTLVVEDSAPSIPSESLDKIFDRLYRFDKSRSRKLGGSGLGLSICKSIVEAHGGSIAASKSLLGGVCVRIELPR